MYLYMYLYVPESIEGDVQTCAQPEWLWITQGAFVIQSVGAEKV